MNYDFTKGSIGKQLLLFSLPLMLGNLLQQLYNIVDSIIVGRFLGPDFLGAVGAAFALMVFLTSLIFGLSMGTSAFLSIQFGKKDFDTLQRGIYISFRMIGLICLAITGLSYIFIDQIIAILHIPTNLVAATHAYLEIIFFGIPATFLYNYFSQLMRAVGNSLTPLVFIATSSIINIGLDLVFIIKMNMGIEGAALATVIAQFVSGLGITINYRMKYRHLKISKSNRVFDKLVLREVLSFSLITSLQQSIMNLGILAVQGLVNSFGTAVMAAFSAGVKIDSFAYMPMQDFGNGFSTFVAQNHGAGTKERMKKGIKQSVLFVTIFCIAVSLLVFIFAEDLICIFVPREHTEVIAIGAKYLRIEGSFYLGIGMLFMLYGYYRAIAKPTMSLILTILSLGSRVALAFILSGIPSINIIGIWMSVPIGWALADSVGIMYYFRYNYDQLKSCNIN